MSAHSCPVQAARGSLGARPHPPVSFPLHGNAARSSDEGSTGRGRAAAGPASAAPGECWGDRGEHGEQPSMRQGTSSNGSLSQWLLGDRDAEHLGLVHEVGVQGVWTSRLSWLLRLPRRMTARSRSERHVWDCIHAASMY